MNQMTMFDFDEVMEAARKAYVGLELRMGDAWSTAEGVLQAKVELEAKRAEALAAGVEARNEACREALLRVRFASEYEALARREEDARWAKHALDVSQAEVDCIRLRVRIMEMAAGLERRA